MPVPLIVGAAALAGAFGAKKAIDGGTKMKEADDVRKLAQEIQNYAIERFDKKNAEVTGIMDEIGNRELEILKSFGTFSDLIEKIQGRPEFKPYKKGSANLPIYKSDEIRKVSMGAGVLLGGLSGAAAGTAGGIAAAGATTTAIMAFGTASTGTAISTLSGAALTNATLAALGGGAIAAGGGGMALGTMVLGGATLGAGLLVGGIIFNVVGSKLSEEAEEAYRQAKKTEEEVNEIVKYLDALISVATKFQETLFAVNDQYKMRLQMLEYTIDELGKIRWNDFTRSEKIMTENIVLLVGLLYKMCQVNLVVKNQDDNKMNAVNSKEVNRIVKEAKDVLSDMKEVA